MNKQAQDEMTNAIVTSLDGDDNNDEALQQRFLAMRRKALDEIPQEKGSTYRYRWSVLGIVSGAVLGFALMLMWPTTKEMPLDTFALDEWDALIDNEDVSMLSENDIDFYMWLEESKG